MENFKEKFIHVIIEKLTVDKAEITLSAKFTEDLDVDSLDKVGNGI